VGAEWEIPLVQLREALSDHESNDRLDACLDRLMRVIVSVPYRTADGEPRILKTHLFDFFDRCTGAELALPGLKLIYAQMARWTEIAKRPDELVSEMHEVNARLIDMLREQQALAAARKRATIRFGIPKKLQPLLRQSNRWGRIKPEVVCAMTSKYAIALYELVQLRRNLDRCVEMFPIDRCRELLGVPPSAYARGNHFIKNVIEPAVLEVNGLSDTGMQAAPQTS
jgi:hypothetical protein